MNTKIRPQDFGNVLISRERTEKLELLHHLVTNVAHAIVVCGPDGIGKTRLLKLFQETFMETWMFCWVEGNSNINLIKILEMVAEAIIQSMPQLKSTPLEKIFDRLEEWQLKVVLVIDNAGGLPPGILDSVITFVQQQTVVRLIFTLTHSELYLKSGTDPVVDQCYQIDIPPLSEKQCGDFLEYLSTLAKPRIQFSAINETRVSALYRETHGIPGKILAQLPKQSNKIKTDYSKLILTLAVVGLIGTAIAVQWWSNRQIPIPTKVAVTEKKLEPKAAVVQATSPPSNIPAETVKPAAVSEQTTPSADAMNTAKSGEIRHDVIDKLSDIAEKQRFPDGQDQPQKPVAVVFTEPTVTQPVKPLLEVEASTNAKPIASEAIPVQAPTPIPKPIPEDEGGRWLLTQPIENQTLQLMALSNEQAIIEVIQRNPGLGQNLKYLKTKAKKGKERYVLLYGSFSNSEQMKTESALLPKELQNYWIRKVGDLQSEMVKSQKLPTDTAE